MTNAGVRFTTLTATEAAMSGSNDLLLFRRNLKLKFSKILNYKKNYKASRFQTPKFRRGILSITTNFNYKCNNHN